MNKILIVCFLLLVNILGAQAPQNISYQGVARNASGSVLSNTTIAVKFDIHRGSPQGTVVFTEQHQGSAGLVTNAFGLFTTAIGSVNSLSGVDWGNGPFFMEVSIDPANGTYYSSVGIQKLMSVPYALYAEKAGNATPIPTITVNSPNTITNTSPGSYSITIPPSAAYTAGSGIDISNGVISTTLSVSTATITGSGQAMVTSSSANRYDVNVPTPSLTVNGGVLTGAYPSQTLTIPASSTASLIAGNGNITLNQSGSDYTLTPITPSLSVTGGTLTGAYPSQTLTIPSSSTTLVQGTNVTLNQNGNSYTVSASTTSLSAGNGNVTLNQSGNAYTITPVTPTLSVNGGTLTGAYPSQTLTIPSSSTTLVQGPNVTLNQNGNSYTVSASTTSLSAGNGNVTLNQSGNAYTITPVTPTLSVNGGTLSGAYPSQTLTIPASSMGLVAGDHVIINQSGNTYTVSSITPTLSVNGGTLSGAYPSQTLTIPASSTTSLSAGNSNVMLNQSGNAYTITPVTPTLSVNGGTLTGAYPSQTLTIPASSNTSLSAGNSNVTLNQSGNAYTITPVTPTLSVNGGTLTGAYPSQTLTIPASSIGLVAGDHVIINQSGSTYTLSSVTPTLSVNGGTLSGAYPSQTLTIPSSLTTLVPGTNVTLNQNGNTYTISSVSPTLTAGTNVTITPTGPANAYTISSGVSSYTGTAGTIAVTGNTINLVPTGVATGTYGLAAANAVPVFSVDNFGRLTSAGQYTQTIQGDVTGNLNTSVVTKIRGIAVSATAPTNGQLLQFTGSAWTPATFSAPWALTGNAGTTASHFIGTTDNLPFRIRTNNTVRAIFTESGQLLVGSGTGYGANSKLIVEEGHIESKQTTAPAIAGAGSLLGLAGSSATLSSNSTDVCGIISIYTGLLGGGSKGNYASITFDKAYTNPPIIILTPRSEDAAGLRAYVTGTTATGFTLAFSTATAGLATYEFNYMVLESN